MDDSTQAFIGDLLRLNETKDLGVGLAAPQVGKDIAVALIDIKPNIFHPHVKATKMVIVNPSYTGVGRRTGQWEGCLSSGSKRNVLFAKALRYKKIKAEWHDEKAQKHSQVLEGLIAQVFQHETDHLNGILFVDRVRDTKTYMHASEYRKRILKG
jgi:peptide deformylase